MNTESCFDFQIETRVGLLFDSALEHGYSGVWLDHLQSLKLNLLGIDMVGA